MKLTLPQQDIYFEQLLYPNEPIYNIGAKIEIRGYINIEVLNKAYVALIDQHDAYRSILIKNHNSTEIEISESHLSELGFIDFSLYEDSIEEAQIYMQKEFVIPFNLFEGNLLHVFTLIKVKDDFHYLFSVYHHIITDGWGTSLMFQRLVQNYNEIFEFGEIRTEYPFSYKDFIEDDEEYQNSESFTQDKIYWLNRFKSLPENLLDKIDDSIQNNKSHRKEFIIKRELYDQLNQLAATYKSSTFHLILAILYTYFGRNQQNNDFAIGLPVLNRSKSKYKKTVGLFMGITPLRIYLDFDDSFEDLINEIKNQLKNDYRHQRLPLGKLIQELQIFKEKEKLFNITLSYEKQNYSTDFHNTQTRVIPLTHQSERVALAIYIREFNELEDVKIDFDYNLNYFDEGRIKQVVNHFENLINEIIACPNKKLKELNYQTKEEEHQLLVDFNNTKVDYTHEKTVIDLFKEQVVKTPKKVALQDDCKSYTYSELNTLSNQIAEYLIATYGEQDRLPIAILLGRSANMVAALLGILKSGRPYIPLDPTFPKDRLSYIVNNSQTKVIISEKDYVLNSIEEVRVLTLENILAGIDELKGKTSIVTTPKDTAYIIYTSGSTGNPKGVEIGHLSLTNFLTSIQQKPGVNGNDILFSVTTYSFDISILEFFIPLISGATLYIASHDVLVEPNLIIQKLEEIKPTIIQATPSFYQMLFNADWLGNKGLKVLCGGDLLSEALAENLLKHSLEVWNMYGPTETTIWSSIKQIEQPKDSSNIGKPINNTQFYIVDKFLSLKPIGTVGSIYIGGEGLAKGYYKNEQLTKEKFIRNPFGDNGFIYETGDLGKWNEKGEIEFLGRNDNQVKIRGYRIELGDIESQLNQYPEIKDSVVIAKKGNQQEDFLVAYILTDKEEFESEEIISKLKTSLPEYMIPNTIIPLELFPLTPNQKVDRKSLSQRDIQLITNSINFKAPNSYLEIKLCAYWKEVLNSNLPISVSDNFFALGGHSLNAVKLIGLINKHLSFAVSLKTIFDYPTIESLANYLQKLIPNQQVVIPLSKSKDFYNVTPSQYSIWIASQQKNVSIAYNMSAAFIVDGSVNLDRITLAINKLISTFEIIRTNFIEKNGVIYQKINDFSNTAFTISSYKSKDDEVENLINQLTNKEFSLENDLLLRVQLLHLETNKFILIFSTHHIVMDGLSLEIFIKEFINNYKESFYSGTKSENTLKYQYKDYSEWFINVLKDNIVKDELFWKSYLQNYLPKDSFDRDYNIEYNQQRGNKYLFELNKDTTSNLKKLALQENVTFYTILMTALNVLISKFSDHDDICIITTNSGRNISELNNQIGMFVKTLILRTQIKSDQTFSDILKRTQDNLLEIDDHQDVPFDKISKSIFDIMLVYQNPEFSFDNNIELNDFKLLPYPISNNYSRIPIVFNLFEKDNKLNGIIDYNCDLFDKVTIEFIALKYTKLLNEILTNPSIEVGLINIESALEKNKVFDFYFDF